MSGGERENETLFEHLFFFALEIGKHLPLLCNLIGRDIGYTEFSRLSGYKDIQALIRSRMGSEDKKRGRAIDDNTRKMMLDSFRGQVRSEIETSKPRIVRHLVTRIMNKRDPDGVFLCGAWVCEGKRKHWVPLIDWTQSHTAPETGKVTRSKISLRCLRGIAKKEILQKYS